MRVDLLRTFLFLHVKMTQIPFNFFFPAQKRIKLINLKMWVLRAHGDYYVFFSGHGGTLHNQGGSEEHSKKFCYTIAVEHL